MGYGPQDWDLLAGIGRPGSDPRVWRHKACGERLEFPDDKHRCPGPTPPRPQPEARMASEQWHVRYDPHDSWHRYRIYEGDDLIVNILDMGVAGEAIANEIVAAVNASRAEDRRGLADEVEKALKIADAALTGIRFEVSAQPSVVQRVNVAIVHIRKALYPDDPTYAALSTTDRTVRDG